MKLIKLKKELGYTFYCTDNIKENDILTIGQGLYGWIYKSEFEEFLKSGFPESGIKYGQYGSGENYEDKTPLITTSRNFKGGIIKDSIVFVYHKSFNDINKNNSLISALIVENKLKDLNKKLRNIEAKSTEVYRISPYDYNSLVDRELKKSIDDISDLYPKLDRPRWYQDLFINLYKNKYSDSNLFLLAFSCGKGKSLTITKTLVEIYDKTIGDVFLLTTKPSTLDQYANQKTKTGYLYSKDILEKYHIVYLRDDINSEFEYDRIKEQASGKKIIFISSKQFLDRYLSSLISDQSLKNLSKFNDSFKNTLKNKISFVISDEGHWGANTEITNKIHSSTFEEDDDIVDEIKSIFSKDVKILYSTATPSSLIFKYNLDKDLQFYLDNEIEESFFNLLDDLETNQEINDNSYNKFLDIISNNSSNNRKIISTFMEQYLLNEFSL